MALSFGTDGVRGIAHSELTTNFVEIFGRAAAEEFQSCSWLVGRDTRESSLPLTKFLANGLASTGGEVFDLGVVPTPLVAAASKIEEMPAVMVSASHNIWSDNGLKIFGPGGLKLSDGSQKSIEQRIKNLLKTESNEISEQQTTPYLEPDADYLRSLVSSLEGRDLQGQRIVIDCANGAASHIAPKVFLALKADLVVINAEPNGRNINAGCGSNQPRMLQEKVLETKADFGLALDGDADRLIAVSGDGAVVDGDQMLCLFATDFASRDLLQSQAVVVTVMSNMGLIRAMAQNNIRVEQTLVGDRNVLAAMNEQGIELGGEQSGHIIFGKHSTTGDGILSGVLLADLMKRWGGDTAAIAASAMKQHPQVLINVPVAGMSIDVENVFAQEIIDATNTLKGSGRVLVRASGTEPIVRVMVEAETEETARSVAMDLAHDIENHVIGSVPKPGH